MPRSTESLDALVRPAAIAIVGASADTGKLNGRIVRFLKDHGYRGSIYPVNPKATEILGLRCYPDIASIGAPIDLAVIGVSAAHTRGAVRDAARAGARAALVFASGFAELGDEGRRLQEELVREAREAGIRLCGPNSVGVVNAFDRIVATFSQVGNNPVNAAPFAFVTQSGAIGTVVNTLANRRGLGVGYLVHTGNEADITAVDAIAAVAADPRVRVIGAYLEGVRDGAALCGVAAELLAQRRPIVAIKVGRSEVGARAVASHTGALAATDRVFDDIARQYGIVRARNETHLLDIAEALTRCPIPAPGGLGLITQSGGTAVMMADRAAELGVEVPTLTSQTQVALREVLPPYASFGNPVDASMQAVADPSLLTEGLSRILRDPQVAVGIAWLQHMDAKADQLVELFGALKEKESKPWIVAWSAAPAAAVAELQRRGVCVAGSADTAVDMAHALISYGAVCRRGVAAVGAPAQTAAPGPVSGVVPSIDAARLLARHGVTLAEARLAHDADEAVRIAAAFGGTVALKVESPDLPHKTEVGGVRLNLADEAAIRAAHAGILGAARSAAPRARIDGVLVQRMAAPGVELVIGLRRDPAFGMTVMLGLGGVLVEVFGDVTFRKAPIDRATAHDMIDSLKGRRLLGAFRGRPAIDVDRLADLLCAVASFGAAHEAWLEELDLNPVIARDDAVMAVDWLMVGRAVADQAGGRR